MSECFWTGTCYIEEEVMPEAQQSQRSAKTLSKASRPQGRSPTCKTRGRYKSCLVKCKNQSRSTQHDRGGLSQNNNMLRQGVGCPVNISQYVTTRCGLSRKYYSICYDRVWVLWRMLSWAETWRAASIWPPTPRSASPPTLRGPPPSPTFRLSPPTR